MVDRSLLLKRLLLVLVVVGQVTLAPIILFALTYLPEINYEEASIGLRTHLIYWVVIAGVSYGMVSIVLALIVGGFRPFFVANQGGLIPFLGFSPRRGDPELVDRARLSLLSSPYGRMSKLVNLKTRDGEHEIMAVHGGLQLLAVPMQVILIAVPLVIMEWVPEEMVRDGRAFDLGMAGYIIALWIAVRIHPIISWQLVGIAAMFRNVVWRVSKLSWILPIFLYWLVARLVLTASLNWLDVDYAQWHEMQLEKIILQTVAPDAEIPPTAILDYIVAISVLPMATFTTISVLGGSQKMPEWMFGQDSGLESLRGGELKQSFQEGSTEQSPSAESQQVEIRELPGDGDNEIERGEGRMIDLPFSLFEDD